MAWAAGNVSDGSSSSGDVAEGDKEDDEDAMAVTKALQNGGASRHMKSPVVLKSAMKQAASVSIFSKGKGKRVIISQAQHQRQAR